MSARSVDRSSIAFEKNLGTEILHGPHISIEGFVQAGKLLCITSSRSREELQGCFRTFFHF
jgi:hypothetical protein